MTATPDVSVLLSGVMPAGDHSLPMLLDFLHQCGRTGILSVMSAHGAATLHYDGGRLQHATFHRVRGVEAVATLLQVTTATTYTFTATAPGPERSIDMSIGHLLMNAAQILDEGRAAPLPVTQVTVVPTQVPARASASMPTDATDAALQVLGRVNDHHTVADLARLLRRDLADVSADVAALVGSGHVTLHDARMHQNFWMDTRQLIHQVAPKHTEDIVAAALGAVDARPGRIPVAQARAFLQAVETALGELGGGHANTFTRGAYRLRQMVFNATQNPDDDW